MTGLDFIRKGVQTPDALTKIKLYIFAIRRMAPRLGAKGVRATFGVAIKDKAITYKISPGGLVKYKREGIPCFDYETILHMVKAAVSSTIHTEMDDFKHTFFN